MVKKPAVSVIIPTYNRADLVPLAIQSVLDQTYQDFEIIVVDDASKDNTEEVVEGFVKQDNRIKYIKHTENKGGSAARNTGIKKSSGDYIAFLDSDCQWLPQKIEKQLKVFHEGNSKLGAVGSRTISTDKSIVKMSDSRGKFGDIHKKLLSGEAFPGRKCWPGGTSTIMIKKECFDKIGLFDEELKSCQEHDLYIRISKYYHFNVVREPLVKVVLDAPFRISLDMEARLKGRKRMLEKYSREMPKISKLKSHFSYVIGSILCRKGNMKEGRSYLFRALISYPFSPRNWINFLVSFLPYHIFNFLISTRAKIRKGNNI